jgi:hypothetical protein
LIPVDFVSDQVDTVCSPATDVDGHDGPEDAFKDDHLHCSDGKDHEGKKADSTGGQDALKVHAYPLRASEKEKGDSRETCSDSSCVDGCRKTDTNTPWDGRTVGALD